MFLDTKNRQQSKFGQLIHNTTSSSPPSTLDKSKVVINLSERALTPIEEVLMFDLNFAIVPNKIPVYVIIAAIEATARHLDMDSVEQLRSGVNEVLTSSKAPHSNLTHNQRKAINSIHKDDDIVILQANKGDGTVVMGKYMYDEKMRGIANNEATYQKLKKDPTTRVKRKMQSISGDYNA